MNLLGEQHSPRQDRDVTKLCQLASKAPEKPNSLCEGFPWGLPKRVARKLLLCSIVDCAMIRKTPAERIPVTDQVGKRHVVLRYVEVETCLTQGQRRPTSEVIEYRLEAGRSVMRTGAHSFQTADGLLMLKVLES